ncbi:hypothetical protein BMF94_3452 [Rhodotorula taiwanensis]|uniref:Uncharacterized protein n=1 Tax=Rhodotorula taiwanensis TaxID=741276 RepID=A0A2S5B9R4_9BASI|nr:hypothetical protein BMF94_3452 [Rhodotorula taiwanensis]
MDTPSASSSRPAHVADDGYLSPTWVEPPSGWPPHQANGTSLFQKPPRSRRRQRSSSVSGSDTESAASDLETSSTWSSSSWDSELAAREAQLQWDESMRQLQALLNLVAVPWIARYFGRKWAYSLFERYLQTGLGKRFFLGPLAAYAPRAWR